MKQQETRSPQVGEPRNGKNERKKRFLIVKLEERITPKKPYKPPFVFGTTGSYKP